MENWCSAGPSGSGKTTLLRIIAGLESPDAGSILLHGEESPSTAHRSAALALSFSIYALFRHMRIFENVAFGLRGAIEKDQAATS